MCVYLFKEDCTDIIDDLKVTRLDGRELDTEFAQDQMGLDSVRKANGDTFILENYKIIFKK
jgi:hypothetical protein